MVVTVDHVKKAEFEYKYARDNLDIESTKSDWDECSQLRTEYLQLIREINIQSNNE
uniref:Uncharacterized protein n=1 Tax=Pyramimonas orientalis virus TaxID=455367 RepID=A0A7L9AZ82_POV01|nr:hypothetical protein HWQ62_00499 [Pyramimonas orientalis virus]